MTRGMELLTQANEIREKGDFLKALQMDDEATLELQKEGNLGKMAEAQAQRYLCFSLLYGKTDERAYLMLAKNAAVGAVEIAESCGDKTALAIPYFNVAKAYMSLEQYTQAVGAFEKALDNLTNNPPESHNRAGVMADFKIHLAEAQYLAGDKDAINLLVKAVEELDASDEKKISSYNYGVWKSGAFMAAARIMKDDDPGKAKEFLELARNIIDSDPALKLRKEQWEKLAKTFV